MARVKFIRDEEPNIRSLETNGGAIDGALYVATDTGNMWMGTDSNALLKLSNPVVVEVDYTASKVTQEQHNTIAASWPNVVLKLNNSLYMPFGKYEGKTYSMFKFGASDTFYDSVGIPRTYSISIRSDTLQLSKANSTLGKAQPGINGGFGIVAADEITLACDPTGTGKLSVKNSGIKSTKLANGAVTADKIADGAVTKAKLGSDIVIPTTKADIGLENVDNTADANKSVKYATSAGSANTASVANSVAWDNVIGAPTIPTIESITDTEIDTVFTQVFG